MTAAEQQVFARILATEYGPDAQHNRGVVSRKKPTCWHADFVR